MKPHLHNVKVGLLLLAAWLTGCSGLRVIDSEVQAFSTLPAGQALTVSGYRFERLPSQVAAPEQAQLEAVAETAFSKLNLRRDEANPSHSIQISAQLQTHLSDPWGGYHAYPWAARGYGGYGWPYGAVGIGGRWPHWNANLGLASPSATYARTVSLLIRELRSGQVVYETRASHQDYRRDGNAVLAAMIEAALKDFPSPPAGARRVGVEIPR